MVVTFITSDCVEDCASALDSKRLNKQISECMWILKDLENNTNTTQPSVAMWIGYNDALKLYTNACIEEWKSRGKNTQYELFEIRNYEAPWWWGWNELILSHKLSLIRKDEKYYADMFCLQDEEIMHIRKVGYVWPSKALNKYGSEVLSKDILEICEPIGKGAPANYRWEIEEVEEWLENRGVNPKTGKKISTTAKKGVYADLLKAATIYKLI